MANSPWLFKDISDYPGKSVRVEYSDDTDGGTREEEFLEEEDPDLALYPADIHQARAAYSSAEPRDCNMYEERREFLARCAYQWMMLFLEYNSSASKAGFHFADRTKYKHENGCGGRKTLSAWATKVFLLQHRTHLFSISMVQGLARIFRWDRTGCIVTQAVDMKDLTNFIFRLAQLTREQLGYDPTVQLASATEIARLKLFKTKNTYLSKAHKDMLGESEMYPVYKVS